MAGNNISSKSYWAGIIVYLATAIILFVLWLVYLPEISQYELGGKVYYILLVNLAISASIVLFGMLPSKAEYKGNILNGTLKLSGAVVCFLLILILGFYLAPSSTSFDFTIFLRNRRGEKVIRDQDTLSMVLGGDILPKRINSEGAAEFRRIPLKYKNSNVRLELNSKGWVFANGMDSTACKLHSESSIVSVRRDSSLAYVMGEVKDENNHLIEGALVSILDLHDTTKTQGEFEIIIPEEKQSDRVEIHVLKEGFQLYEIGINPRPNAFFTVTLKKKS